MNASEYFNLRLWRPFAIWQRYLVIKLFDTNPEYIIIDNISMIPYR